MMSLFLAKRFFARCSWDTCFNLLQGQRSSGQQMMNLKVVCAFCCCFVQHLFYSALLHSELSSTEQSFTCNYRRQPDWNPSLESTTFQIPPTLLRSSCAPKTPYNLKIGFYWQGILTVSQCKNWLLHCDKNCDVFMNLH